MGKQIICAAAGGRETRQLWVSPSWQVGACREEIYKGQWKQQGNESKARAAGGKGYKHRTILVSVRRAVLVCETGKRGTGMLASYWILIVDDEPKLRFTLSVILKRNGYLIACAADGQSALRMLRTRAYDLMCLDIRLPDIDGLSLLTETSKIAPQMPVVVLTADDSVDTTMQALQMGACGYLLKPLNPWQILTCMRKLLPERPLPKIGAISPSRGRILEPLDEY